MTFTVAVANRKGGVGKSTVATMLAHGFAVWGGKRTLLIDLDTQCNSSLMLVGGERWKEARYNDCTIADYFYAGTTKMGTQLNEYIIGGAGDIIADDGTTPQLSLFCGSVDVDDILDELLINQAQGMKRLDIKNARTRVANHLSDFLKRTLGHFDVVVIDCPPGISLAVDAALKLANHVVVPFRPDYVSQYAIDRIAQRIENKANHRGVRDVPFDARRYKAVANFFRPQGPDQFLVDLVAEEHPIMETRIQQSHAIAESLDWQEEGVTMDEKYGPGVSDVLRLYNEVADEADHIFAQAA